jgi:outer membrane receptor protein involved in Fe transport
MNQTGDLAAAPFFYQQDVNGVFLNGASATGTFGFAFPTLRGNDTLRPEEADTWTAGVVLSSPFSSELLSNMRLSVDWFNIKVDDAIGSQTIAVALRQCLDPSLNPLVLTDPTAAASTAFCQNVPRNPVTGALGNVTTTFVNNGRFEVEGIDANLSWRAPVGPGTVGLNVLFNYLIDFKSAELVTDPLAEFVGTLGVGQNGLNPGPFEYRVLTDLNYSIGAFTLGMQWQHLPSIEDGTEGQFGPTPTTGFSSYNIFHLNSSFTINDAVTVRFGVDNLFNKDPEIGLRNLANNNPSVTGQLPGGSFNTDFYDTNGRRFYVGANLEF